MPPVAKPPQRKAAFGPGPGDGIDSTDPGGPAPEVLSRARRQAGEHPRVSPGPGDATLVYDRSKGRRTPAAESPRLVITAGPRKGTEHALAEELITIGRGTDNLLVIPDISVSRRHSRLEKQGGRWVVLDQGSGNGTRVNGRPVERHALQHGDEIEIGDTRLQYVEPGGVLVKGGTPSSPVLPRATGPGPTEVAQGALNRRTPLLGAVAAAVAIVIAAGVVRRQQRLRMEAEAAEQGDESRAFAQKRFHEGVALLKQGKWVEARDKLKIASELDGQDPGIARYLASAQLEAPRAQQLAAARAALERRDYLAARTAVGGIPEDSALAEGAHELAIQLAAALDGAVREARAQVESGDAAAAQELLEPVLAAEPSRADALAVRDAIAAQNRRAAAPARRRGKRAEPVPPAPEVQGILEAYLAGDVAAALERAQEAQGPEGERLFAELKTFEAAYRDALAKLQGQGAADAVRALERAAAADRNIAQGRDGRPGREVRKALSAQHRELARAVGTTDEALPEAAAHLRAAAENDPSDEAALAELRQVADRCKEIYLRGYVAKDSDAEAARSAFRLVIETLPASDDTARKAKRWLDKLDGRLADGE